jgi:hypothetical protein
VSAILTSRRRRATRRHTLFCSHYTSTPARQQVVDTILSMLVVSLSLLRRPHVVETLLKLITRQQRATRRSVAPAPRLEQRRLTTDALHSSCDDQRSVRSSGHCHDHRAKSRLLGAYLCSVCCALCVAILPTANCFPSSRVASARHFRALSHTTPIAIDA